MGNGSYLAIHMHMYTDSSAEPQQLLRAALLRSQMDSHSRRHFCAAKSACPASTLHYSLQAPPALDVTAWSASFSRKPRHANDTLYYLCLIQLRGGCSWVFMIAVGVLNVCPV